MKLEAIKAAAKAKFEPFVVELEDASKIVLLPMLKLEEEGRAAVKAAIEDINSVATESDDEEVLELVVEAISKIFQVVADKPTKLLAELHDDDLKVKVHILTEVLTEYARATKLGEVSNSPS